jgi:hypothetical protein
MNAANPLPSINAQDYRETMQAVARDYLVRHWMEHLDDGQLFERACLHLVAANSVPVFLAQRLVYLAMSTLTPANAVVGVDWGGHEDSTAMVIVQQGPDGVLTFMPRTQLLPPTSTP